MKWLKRRLQRWLEIDTTIGNPGFVSINYKGEPVTPDTSPTSGEIHVVEDGENFLVFNSDDIDTSGVIKRGYDNLK